MNEILKTGFKKRTPAKQLSEDEIEKKADEIANRAEKSNSTLLQNDGITKSRKPTTTLYCNKSLHNELKKIALNESLQGKKVSVNDLLIEGIGLVLDKRGKSINDYL